FFSSRRRHTRFSRDWSSDVCSSDLPQIGQRLSDRLVQFIPAEVFGDLRPLQVQPRALDGVLRLKPVKNGNRQLKSKILIKVLVQLVADGKLPVVRIAGSQSCAERQGRQ